MTPRWSGSHAPCGRCEAAHTLVEVRGRPHVAHLLAYTGHGMQGPAYSALLHREATSTPMAMAAAGVFGLGGVWCLLPALRAERRRPFAR